MFELFGYLFFGTIGFLIFGVAIGVMIDEYALRPVRVRKARLQRRIDDILK
jgi:hypothetical protein